MSEGSRPPLELWGGLECTINRVRDLYFDQLEMVDAYRLEHLVDLVQSTGVRRVRWPVLWERAAPDGIHAADWTWPDRTLAGLAARGIQPIVGLVHHGSGPRHTSLLDPGFASGLASFARACARRYPDVRLYTPINEPLTTARFSALYGHWYPHHRDDRSFVAALVVQTRATIEAMQAIRHIRPDAGLVQTEDAGRTTATAPLSAQAAFEDVRRWLSLDLLMGRVDGSHPLRAYLAAGGFTCDDEAWFRAHAMAPEIVGLNYYVTSDRHLDHRLQLYRPETHGGNGVDRYADVEAARATDATVRGHADVLLEAWQRYGRPVAITEAHLGCTREEQLRWLRDAWVGAGLAREAGADVRAVTLWALLGSTDWSSLVRRRLGHYEPGAFDMRSGTPRPTAIAAAATSLAAGGQVTHPAVVGTGWWSRGAPNVADRRPLLVLGATGTLGSAVAHACRARGLEAITLKRAELDLLDATAVRARLRELRPWGVVNATGYVRVDDAERESRTCRLANAVAPSVLAMACRKLGVRLATFSTDLVFDGEQSEPYCEGAPVAPLNTYGRSKLEGEKRVLALDADALVVRTSAFFGPWDHANFVTCALGHLEAGRPFRALSDLTVSPTYVPHLVDAALDLLIDGAGGLWHLANRGAVTWLELAQRAATRAGLQTDMLHPCRAADENLAARRPRYSVLGTTRGALLPTLDEAIDTYTVQRTREGRAA